jgi:hypothetical protein
MSTIRSPYMPGYVGYPATNKEWVFWAFFLERKNEK